MGRPSANSRRGLLAGGAALGACALLGGRLSAAPPALPFRISTENAAGHVQTRAVARFAAALERRAAGRLTVVHHPGGEMFRDRDVIKALQQGRLEMAVPGTWQLDRLEPSAGLYFLPAFFGRDSRVHDRVRDGSVGAEINRRLEDGLGIKVLGRWTDLGFAHVYGVHRRIGSHADLKGMRIRVAGGEANLHRLAALGAMPRVIPWTDLPASLADGTVDGIVTTHESVASARLWEFGIGSALEDHQYFAQYVPLVGGAAWAAMPVDLRRLVAAVWEETVDWARAEAATAQAAARDLLAGRGVVITRPSRQALAAERARLVSVQPAVVAAMGMDEGLVARAMAALASADQPG